MTEPTLSAENQDALDDLLVAIEAGGRRLGIFIAVCDDPQLREEIIAAYEQALGPEFKHYPLALNPEAPSLRSLVAQQVQADAYLQQGGKAVMTVLGAEALRKFSFDEEPSQQAAFFGYLQWTREGLQSLPFAIVLWVTTQLQEQLSRKAPDFWSWRRDVIRFVSPKRQAIATDKIPALRQDERFAAFVEEGSTLPIADLEALIADTESSSPESPLLASLYSQLGRAYVSRLEAGRSQDYKAELEKAIAYLKNANHRLKDSKEKEEYLICTAWLARGYELQGRYSEAEPLYVQALEIRKAELGNRHPSTATSLNNLAGLYKSQGRYSEAEPLYQQALEINQSELGDGDAFQGNRHLATATSLNNLALLYRSQGRYSEAEPLYLQALEIRKAELGDRHPDTATSLNNLAGLYKSQGRYSEAEPLYQQALEINQSELGDGHLSTASSLNNLAALYRSQGRYSEAEPLYQQALEISKAELGERHPDTALSFNNLAGLYDSQGRYSEAEPLYVQALEISKSELGDRHPSTALSLNNLAALYESQGRYSEAESLYLQALEIRKAELGDGNAFQGNRHPSTASSLNNLALLYKSQGRYSEAEPLYLQALEIRKAELGDGDAFQWNRHPSTANSLFNLAVLYHQTERSQQALPLIQQAIAIYTDVLGTEHPNTQAALSWLPLIEAEAHSATLPKWFPFKRLLHQLAQRLKQ